MPALIILYKAYKLKKAVKHLQKAKENAIRIHHGKEPNYPWYENCWTWFVNCSKDFCCRAFCPCCIAKPSEGLNYSENFCKRFCISGTFENYIIKSFLGFAFGCVFTLFMFLFLINQLNLNPRITTVICSIIGLFLTIGLSFSDKVRCIVLLILPELFSNRGRFILLAYAYILVMSGPAKNVIRNTKILVESMSCGQELIANQTKAVKKAIFDPLVAIVDSIREVLAAIENFARQIKDAFISIRDMFVEILNAIQLMFGWILSITSICNDQYGTPFEKCEKAFNEAIEDCRYRLGVFKFMCEVVTAVKYICQIAKVVDLLCLIPDTIKTAIIEPLKKHLSTFAERMYEEFFVNVTLEHYYNITFEQSKSFEEIRGDIHEEIAKRIKWLTSLIDISDLLTTMFMIIIAIKAMIYRYRYLKLDYYDNIYISYQVKELDYRRGSMGKETILPLSFRERFKYIHTFSLFLQKTERKRLIKNAIILSVTGVQMAFYMILDYSLYIFLKMLRFNGKVTAKSSMPSQIGMNVEGEGVMADMYKKVISSFDPVLGTAPKFDTTECLPNPIPIDVDKYQQIGIIFGLCFILSITESYGLRLRHVVCGNFYPNREKERAIWLYNHILRTRGGLLKFLRRKIKKKFYGEVAIEKVSFIDKLVYQFPKTFGRLLKSLGYIRIYCICCSEPGKPDDTENFKSCSSPACKGIYCLPCFEDIKNLCTLCKKPVEYGDQSDISEELDSSDEEKVLNEVVNIKK